MDIDRKQMDSFIDSGRTTIVYHAHGCKNRYHNPESKRCEGCHFHRIETKSYRIERNTLANPNSEIFSERHFGILSFEDFKPKEHHCAMKDYISARRLLKKLLKET